MKKHVVKIQYYHHDLFYGGKSTFFVKSVHKVTTFNGLYSVLKRAKKLFDSSQDSFKFDIQCVMSALTYRDVVCSKTLTCCGDSSSLWAPSMRNEYMCDVKLRIVHTV